MAHPQGSHADEERRGVSDVTSQPSGLYENPAAALKQLSDNFDYWTGRITDSSFALSIAVIGANWAVFGSLDKILLNRWSQFSLSTVLFGLGINLLGIKLLSDWLQRRIDYAEADHTRWAREFELTRSKNDPWPLTRGIRRLTRFLRECRTWLPLIGGILFLIALFTATRADAVRRRESTGGPVSSAFSPHLPQLRVPTCDWARLGLHPHNADGVLLPEQSATDVSDGD